MIDRLGKSLLRSSRRFGIQGKIWLGNVLLTMKLLPNGIIFRVNLFWPKNNPINTANK